jgi:hypothetical protein
MTMIRRLDLIAQQYSGSVQVVNNRPTFGQWLLGAVPSEEEYSDGQQKLRALLFEAEGIIYNIEEYLNDYGFSIKEVDPVMRLRGHRGEMSWQDHGDSLHSLVGYLRSLAYQIP